MSKCLVWLNVLGSRIDAREITWDGVEVPALQEWRPLTGVHGLFFHVGFEQEKAHPVSHLGEEVAALGLKEGTAVFMDVGRWMRHIWNEALLEALWRPMLDRLAACLPEQTDVDLWVAWPHDGPYAGRWVLRRWARERWGVTLRGFITDVAALLAYGLRVRPDAQGLDRESTDLLFVLRRLDDLKAVWARRTLCGDMDAVEVLDVRTVEDVVGLRDVGDRLGAPSLWVRSDPRSVFGAGVTERDWEDLSAYLRNHGSPAELRMDRWTVSVEDCMAEGACAWMGGGHGRAPWRCFYAPMVGVSLGNGPIWPILPRGGTSPVTRKRAFRIQGMVQDPLRIWWGLSDAQASCVQVAEILIPRVLHGKLAPWVAVIEMEDAIQGTCWLEDRPGHHLVEQRMVLPVLWD